MRNYIIKRVLISAFTLLAITLVLFALLQLMPGSPFNDEKLNNDQRAVLNAKYGLDQPLFVQFGRYVFNMARGDFGVSYNISKNTPISQLVQTRLPVSLNVGGMAVGLGALVGLLLGIVAALNHRTIIDNLCTVISVLGVSVPSYVFALALSYERLRRNSEAIAAYEEYLRLAPAAGDADRVRARITELSGAPASSPGDAGSSG